jgi:ABC-type antimicrobial peptide transport system permease subunit
VILGAAGVGLVVLRQAAARRRELALLVAVGLPRRQLWHYWMAEYLYLLLAGLVAGVLPALVAMQPALRSLGQELPVGVMAAVIAAMGATGALGITAAVLATTRLPLPAALRGE